MSSLDRWADQLDDERLIRSFSDHLRSVGVIPTLAPWRAENATGDGSICVFELETQDPIRLVNLRVIREPDTRSRIYYDFIVGDAQHLDVNVRIGRERYVSSGFWNRFGTRLQGALRKSGGTFPLWEGNVTERIAGALILSESVRQLTDRRQLHISYLADFDSWVLNVHPPGQIGAIWGPLNQLALDLRELSQQGYSQ